MEDSNAMNSLMIKLKTTEMQFQMIEKKYNRIRIKKRKRISSHHVSATFDDRHKKNSCISLPTESYIDLSNSYVNKTKSVS